MHITVNDEQRAVQATTLEAILAELGYAGARIATALDGVFVPTTKRATTAVAENARLEILAPMQGG